MKQIQITLEFKDHDKVILTNPQGDTYTSKSEELMDFLHGAKPPVSGSLPSFELLRKAYHAGMVEAIKRKCAEEDNYEYKEISFDMWLSSVSEVGGNDR